LKSDFLSPHLISPEDTIAINAGSFRRDRFNKENPPRPGRAIIQTLLAKLAVKRAIIDDDIDVFNLVEVD